MMQSPVQSESFDYIIAGAGCAGLSLLLRILQEPTLRNKTILVIDNDDKTANDRTWCFWEKKEGFFENLVYHRWHQLLFQAGKASISLSIQPYAYKMIRSIDLYSYTQNMLQKRSKIKWLKAEVQALGNENNRAYAQADNIKYTAQYVFNSILFDEDKKALEQDNCYKLLQHFKGWVIETDQPAFNPGVASFMDFRVAQDQGTAFVYVLPTSPTRALVEYTFFNKQLLPKEDYDILLKNYLQQFLNLSNYTIVETEYGIIPMTNHQFKANDGNIINIGTAGGWTKASSGFTFQFIQKNAKAILAKLLKNEVPVLQKSFFQKRFYLYDATLLNILHNNTMPGRDIFHQLFSKVKVQALFRFLDNESSLKDEIQILNSVPSKVFLPAAKDELFAMLNK
ncbi:lycopene cyclase family protein [Parasediminibacterium sp. JCM 36343]|uniref:lycopene cyclase family protein n=1 Tax=Parasediminibacterium sp. JCM 36343 TaxID=3374279 RepID=UPI00397C64F0